MQKEFLEKNNLTEEDLKNNPALFTPPLYKVGLCKSIRLDKTSLQNEIEKVES